MENGYSLQEALDQACNLVREAHELLEAAEERVPETTGNTELDKQIKRYIQASKDLGSGFLNWR